MAACVLLVLLIFGVGSVMAFVLGQATPMALSVDAALLAMSWHSPRPDRSERVGRASA
jgi:hypothetical protein